MGRIVLAIVAIAGLAVAAYQVYLMTDSDSGRFAVTLTHPFLPKSSAVERQANFVVRVENSAQGQASKMFLSLTFYRGHDHDRCVLEELRAEGSSTLLPNNFLDFHVASTSLATQPPPEKMRLCIVREGALPYEKFYTHGYVVLLTPREGRLAFSQSVDHLPQSMTVRAVLSEEGRTFSSDVCPQKPRCRDAVPLREQGFMYSRGQRTYSASDTLGNR